MGHSFWEQYTVENFELSVQKNSMDYRVDGVHAFHLHPPLLVKSAKGFGTTGRPLGGSSMFDTRIVCGSNVMVKLPPLFRKMVY